MKPEFWLERWDKDQIGFHESVANPLLVQHFAGLSLDPGARIFVPLCGKSLDIGWLLSQGFAVVGAELAETAVQQLFEELGQEPDIAELKHHRRYSAPNLDIFVGNIFDLNAETLGDVDAVYDRAALIALPQDLRRRYGAHLMDLTRKARQLLLVVEYDQNLRPGPPFSVDESEVRHIYEEHYRLTCLGTQTVAGGLKGIVAAQERVWLLES